MEQQRENPNGQEKDVKKRGIVRRMWATLYGKLVLLTILLVVVIAFTWGVVEGTSVPSFCGSCHEIEPSVASWKHSEHYIFEDKIRARCRNCHIPGWNEPMNVILVKVSHGAKNIYHHFANAGKFNDPEWRFGLKAKAEVAVTDQVCLRCHSGVLDKDKDVIQMDGGGEIKGLHTSEVAKNLRCLVCHKHTGHDVHR